MATVKVPEQKVILVGEYGVGKSSLFRRYASDIFVNASDRQSTLGLDHFGKVYTVGERAIKLQLWDTGGMERVASITSSYYKHSEAAILVFALDRPDSFHVLSQHLLDIVTYAENAKIFLCGNKFDLKSRILVTDGEMEVFSEQCHNLMSGMYKTSCKTGDGVSEMFQDIATQLAESNRSKIELQTLDEARSFRIDQALEVREGDGASDCNC
eukprot:maker-scaffold21_size687808-snap-gene-5.37 protein:Tk09842 transcript:maker-scaffold21_size687808-snap-gene-5.37-mRNA-1 annotation:"ras-related protein rab-30"